MVLTITGDYTQTNLAANYQFGPAKLMYLWGQNKVGVTKTLGKFALGLSFIDGSDLKDGPGKVFDSRSKIVATVSTTLPWSAE